MAEEENKIILYTTDDGKSQVSLMSRDGRVWLNQKQMAELFAVSKPNISMLIAKIFAEKSWMIQLLSLTLQLPQTARGTMSYTMRWK